ncbi:MAG: POTRA domain-containing protein, partial [Fusobacterium sp.]|nr:POTRA domain-containing protein [Fusobacterium sp.]
MRKQLVALMVFLLGLLSFAGESNYSIKKIEVVNNREIPYEIILDVMVSKEGNKFVTENMIEDYKNIKGLEYVADVAVQPTVYDGGIKLIVNVLENRDAKTALEKNGIIPLSERGKVDTSLLVNSVEFVGNQYVSKDELAKLVPIKVGGYFSKNKVIEGHKNLIESGYFRDVAPDAVKSGNGVKIIYSVMENPVLNGVNIIGNTVYSTEELMKVIKTEPGKVFNINTIREDRDRI